MSLLNYGAAAQTYKDYNTENLANAKLEESDKVTSEYDFSEQDCKQEGKSNGVTWSGAYLYLIDTAELRFAFTVGEGVDVSKLTVVFTWKGGEHKYTSDKFVTVGNKYYVYFDMVAATDMKEPVKVKVMQGDDVQLSTTLTYSVYSYGWQVNEANKKDGSMENELALVKSLLVYGDAAYAYAQAKNQD